MGETSTEEAMMAKNLERELVKYLSEAHAMEKQALQLLDKGADMVGDEEVARIFRAHRLQTQEHERYVAERLQAHGETPSKAKDLGMQAGALGIGLIAQAAPDTPVRLATTAFAFENLEIAAYRLIEGIAARAGDEGTVAVARRIREQEEAAAELVAGTFDRALELALGEPARSPLPPLTPLGKPSEREQAATEHEGPQSFKDHSPDEPVSQPPHIDTPTERDEHFASPGVGHPAGATRPYGQDG
jgi:ferritin-like metal-binding protein YciE